jgi:hypothetical protein
MRVKPLELHFMPSWLCAYAQEYFHLYHVGDSSWQIYGKGYFFMFVNGVGA